MRISYSSLDNFQNCPLKYKYSEIDKIKEPANKEKVFGSYIHRVLKWFYSKEPHFPALEGLLEYYYNHWPKQEEGFCWVNEKEERDFFQEGMRILEEYYRKNFPPKSIILDLETKFEAVIDETPDKPGGKHILTGIIDRVDKLPDGTIEIIDYKTGKRVPSQEETDKNLQLSLYALGLKQRWPKIKTEDLRLSLYFLKFNEKIGTRKKENDLKETEEKIIELIHKIERSSFQPKSSNLCHWCGYRPICPVWKHLYEKDKEKSLNGLDIEKKIDEYFTLKEEKEKIEEKLKVLKDLIEVYSRQKGLKRIFGKNGYFSENILNRVSYDKEKVKEILAPLGKWDDVLKIDSQKLDKVLKEIPPAIREKIEKAKKVEKEYKYLETNHKTKKEVEEQLL